MGHVPRPLLFAAIGDDFLGGNIAFSSAHDFRIPTEHSHMASNPNRKSLFETVEQRVLGY